MVNGPDRRRRFSTILTGSNADEGGARIDDALREFCAARPERIRFFQNLGTQA